MQDRIIEKETAAYPELGKIGDNLTSLKSNVGDLVSHVKEKGLNDLAGIARDEYENFSEISKKIEKKVMEQPAKSIALAFAGGLLASFLFGRR